MNTISIVCHHIRRTRVHLTLAVIAAIVFAGHGSGRPDVVEAQARTGCAAAVNPIVCENALPGHTDGHIVGVGDTSIQGFATDMSVDIGGTIDFKIKTDASVYSIDIYRLGYYGGAGARKVATLTPTPRVQPACITEPATGLYDCGNWQVSASWAVPMSTVSGIHVARLSRPDSSPGESHIVFIVRDDTRQADVQFQSADTTWQAYNRYGGVSTYCVNGANGFLVPNDQIGFSSAGTAYACARRA